MKNTDFNKFMESEIVFNSKKADRNISIKVSELPLESVFAVFGYGGKRFINDKIGGSEVDQKEAAEIFDSWIKRLKEGNVGRQSSGTDPVETKARAIARDQVKAAILNAGKQLKEFDKEKLAKMYNTQFEKAKDDYLKVAKEILEAEKAEREKASKEVDLSSLGI